MRLSLARRLIVAAISASLAAAAPSGAAEPDAGLALTYQPVVATDGSFRAVDVTLRFRGAASGVTIIDLPNEWGGFDKLYTYLGDMRAENAMLAPSADPAKIALRHAPGAPIVLRYRVRGADRPEQLQDGEVVNDYRPLIQPTWFHLIGDAVVARPEHLDGDTPASFSVRGMPAGTRFASDLEHPGLTLDGLIESIAVGGDFRLIDAGHGARLAVRGSFATRDDAGWTQSFRRVAAAMSDYWGNDAGRYLVTIIPFAPPGPGATSIGGTGRGDAFAFFATTNALPEMLDRLMAHEMAHSWVNVRIGGFSEKVPEAEQFWLSEGFTDFTSWRALVRAGVWTPEQYFPTKRHSGSPICAGCSSRTGPTIGCGAHRAGRRCATCCWQCRRLLRPPAAMRSPCSERRRSAATRRSAKASPASSIAANRLRCLPTCSPPAGHCANSNDRCSIAASMSMQRSRTAALSPASSKAARRGRPGCATA